jgi:hypothetical protein
MHGALSPAVREKISKSKIEDCSRLEERHGFENLQTVHEVDQSPHRQNQPLLSGDLCRHPR